MTVIIPINNKVTLGRSVESIVGPTLGLELCTSDHRNDPEILQQWLRNKTVGFFLSWLRQPGLSLLVAIEGAEIFAVGAVTDAGDITLNYVSPDARFRGVSRRMLSALETRAAERGSTRCMLTSTETARCFYGSAGYLEDGPPVGEFGTTAGHPMTKPLI